MSPWNGPVGVACLKMGPALAAGCTFILKPAEEGLTSVMLLAEAVAATGFPPGVVSILPADRTVGEYLVKHPDVDKITFTGSTAAGRRIMSLCAPGVKRVTLELGGSDPMIICDDADLAAAASAASMGRFYNCGQACLAIKRVYVFESVADEVVEAIVGKARRLKVGRGRALVSVRHGQPWDADQLPVPLIPVEETFEGGLPRGQLEASLADEVLEEAEVGMSVSELEATLEVEESEVGMSLEEFEASLKRERES